MASVSQFVLKLGASLGPRLVQSSAPCAAPTRGAGTDGENRTEIDRDGSVVRHECAYIYLKPPSILARLRPGSFLLSVACRPAACARPGNFWFDDLALAPEIA